MPHAPPDTLVARRRLLRPTLPSHGGPFGFGFSVGLLRAGIVGAVAVTVIGAMLCMTLLPVSGPEACRTGGVARPAGAASSRELHQPCRAGPPQALHRRYSVFLGAPGGQDVPQSQPAGNQHENIPAISGPSSVWRKVRLSTGTAPLPIFAGRGAVVVFFACFPPGADAISPENRQD